MAFDCSRMFRLNVLSSCIFELLFILRCTVDIPAVVADEWVGLFPPGETKETNRNEKSELKTIESSSQIHSIIKLRITYHFSYVLCS